MADFQDKKIPIFTDVNDVPVAPTADRGGNISHFYDKYNQLVDDLEEHITDVEELAGDGFDLARNADASAYDYYYYNSLPNKNYIIFQNHNTSFNLGNHDLNLGETRIGTIPANGELFRIIAEGEINNYQDILFKVSNVSLNVPKFAFYGTGAIWWFYDIAKDYNDPYNGNSIIVTEGEIINVVTSTAETNINFKLEMNVYATLATQQSTPTLEVFEFSQLSTVPQPDNTDVAVIGIIPKTGKLQKIVIDNIANGFNTFFSKDGGNNVLSFDSFEAISNGYQWLITDDDSQDVVQGQQLTMQALEEELGFTINLYILG